MSEPANPLLPHGGYRKLRSYAVAEAVYDATVVFCRRFLAGDRRTSDQMVQAARSGVRNISEGSGAAATSRKTEMKLTNVARASLADELLRDYESFLRQNGLRVWPKESPEARAMRERLTRDHAGELPPAPPGKVRLTGAGRSGGVRGQGRARARGQRHALRHAPGRLSSEPAAQAPGGDVPARGGVHREPLSPASAGSRPEPKPTPTARCAASPCAGAPPAKARRQGNRSGGARAIPIAPVQGQRSLQALPQTKSVRQV